MTLRLAIYGGFLLAFPLIVYHIWSFLSPALERDEKKAIVPALYLGLLLFIGGVALVVASLSGFAVRSLRNVEIEVPDAIP